MTFKKIKSIFDKYIDNNLIKKVNYTTYINIYNKINNDINEINLSSYEINKFLLKNKESIYTSFVKLKNIEILKQAFNSKFWKMNLDNLKKINTNISIKELEKKYKDLFMSRYLNCWDGFWTSININKKGKIISINTIDIDDIKYIIN